MVKLELRHFNATEETTTMTKDSKTLGKVVQIDDRRIQDHLGELVRGTVEETLNTPPLCQDSCRAHIVKKKSNRGRQESEECRDTVKSSKSKWCER